MHAQAIASSKAHGRWAKDAWLRALERTAPIHLNASDILPILVETLAERFGAAPALIDDIETLSYRGLAERANRYAHWAIDQGITAGDVVCVLVPNCADYLALWLGVTRVGGVAALINTHLVGAALVHAIDIVSPRHVVVGAAFADAFLAARAQIRSAPRCWSHGGTIETFPRIDEDVRKYVCEPPPLARRAAPTLRSPALLIYTSGTTGLPKAAKVSHFRIWQWSHWFAGLMDAQPSDRMYDCLPMYHSVGGVVATGAMLVSGGSAVLRPRFSASKFWDEVDAWDCTLFQYIGELCRFLVQSPPHPRETTHRLRLCCGNGMRADIWPAFEQRFRIPRILEFYAATEGSFALYNCEGQPGAIGRIPPFLPQRAQVVLIRFDLESGMPIRGEDGLCIPCAANEIGEALGTLESGRVEPAGFEGYTDPEATQRKILRDVFVRGDVWFRSGDLMRKDERGFFYFVDRVGDAFRWKGENVSSQQVAETLAACPGIVAAIAYGVTVPGTEGRAGMTALVINEAFRLDSLRHYIAEQLPPYARPIFVRLCQTLEMTSTFKPRKQELVREAYDPAATADPIFMNDSASRAFVRLDAELYARIQRNELRF